MHIWLIEPYHTGSHAAWAEGYSAHSAHEVTLLTLPGRFWKWRMHGAAITLARRARALPERPDLILASDMLNLPLFLALGGEAMSRVPVAAYFHENQLTYPLPKVDGGGRPGRRDLHYGFTNLSSALLADAVLFNSAYHQDRFLNELPRLLRHFPDYNELWSVEAIRAKSRVLPLGLDLRRHDAQRPIDPRKGPPLLLWNHRWEHDKGPEAFFRAIYSLAGEGLAFEVALLGESFRRKPAEFLEARDRLGKRIVQFGYAPDAASYSRWLWEADVVVSSARHEFFGAAVAEAIYCGCWPILPHDLAYPELIPAAWHEACLYPDEAGLVQRLRQAIEELEDVRTRSLWEAVAPLDWAEMAPQYDAILNEIAQGGHSDPLAGAGKKIRP
jgi:glycosyltransferase involved in cell wall biosynthesis